MGQLRGARSPAGTRPAERTRRALIDAGWSLLDSMTLGESLESLTAAEIAREAGGSERTFWNHFRDWRHYTHALVADIPRRGPMEPGEDYDAVAVVDDALAGSTRSGFPELVRFAALANWQEVTQPGELLALRRQLFLMSRTGAEPELADTLASDYYGRYIPMLRAIYESAGRQAAVAPLDPLDWEQLTRALAALSEGLVMQSMADPETVTEDFVVEATTALALGLLGTVEGGESTEERSAAFGGPEPGLRDDPELMALAHRCRPVIDAHGSLGNWTRASSATGLSVLELRNRAQRVSVLEALAFREAQPFAMEGDEHAEDRSRRAFEGICRLVRAARRDVQCASSLLAERLCTGPDGSVLRSLLPLGPDLAVTLEESPRSHHDRVVNVALCAALSDTASSPAEIAELACGAHPSLTLGAS